MSEITSISSRRKHQLQHQQSVTQSQSQQLPVIQPIQQAQQSQHLHQFKMNNLKIYKFDGTTDVNTWLEDFELNKLIMKWTEDDLKSIIPASLTGAAKTWFEIKKNDLDTYDKFCKEIKKEFNKINFRSLKKMVETRKQQHGENFGNYCLFMYKICKEWRDDIKEIEIVNYIYDGTYPSLRSKLSSNLDLSFLEFMNKGKIYEELLEKEVNILKHKNINQNNFKKNNFENNFQSNKKYPSNSSKTFNQVRNNNTPNQQFNRNNNRFRNNSGNRNNFQTRNNTNNFRNVKNNTKNSTKKWNPKRINVIEEEHHSSSEEESFNESDNECDNETNLLISSDTGILKAELRLNNVLSLVVLDTGSSISLINSQFAKKLRVKIDNLSTKITTANNTHLNVFGKSLIQLEIDRKLYTHEFLIANFKYPVLIGMDFLEKHNFMIDLKNKSLNQINLTSNLLNQSSIVNELINKYSLIFNDNPSSPAKLEPMKIELTSEKCKSIVYRTSQTEDLIISQEVKKMLEQKIIRKSKSNFSFPVILVRKKDNSFRFCIDFRNLNKVTIRDNFPLPRIDEMLNKLGDATYFSKLDCSSGYWQIPLSESDKFKTAFRTKYGLYEFNVIPFGLINAPSHFQRIMNQLIEPYSKFCSVYLDDVIVFSNTLEEHLNHLEKIFSLFKQVNLRLKLKKCEFAATSIEYLGHKVTKGKISPMISKIGAIENEKPPSNIKELQQFLNMFSRVIPVFLKQYTSLIIVL